jgi:hypothetical protein
MTKTKTPVTRKKRNPQIMNSQTRRQARPELVARGHLISYRRMRLGI